MVVFILLKVLLYIFIGLVLLFTGLYFYRRFHAHQYFRRLGIPGPKPHWLFGNLLALADESRRHIQLTEWTKKYGSVYGIYEGSSPQLVISDLEAVNNVFIKQFGTFHARKLFHYQPDPDDPNELISVFFARGDRWKRLRTSINPAFTSKKMKEMSSQMQHYQETFEKLLAKRQKEAGNDGVDALDLFQLLTMDTVGECAFGIELNSIGSEGKANPMLKTIQEMLDNTFKIPPILLVTTVLPEFKPIFNLWVVLMKAFAIGIKGTTMAIYKTVRQIVEERRSNSAKRRNDMMQLLLDGEETAGEKGRTALKALTPSEIEAQVYIFLIAGYEV